MRRADNLTTFMCRLSRNSGASTSWNHKGLSRLVSKRQVKFFRYRPEQALGDPEVKALDFLTFGTMKVVRSSPLRNGCLYPQEFTGTHFYKLSRPQGTWFRWWLRKKFPATPLGIDPETLRLAAQCLNHYATPGP